MCSIGIKIAFSMLIAALGGFAIGYIVGKGKLCQSRDETYDNMEKIPPKDTQDAEAQVKKEVQKDEVAVKAQSTKTNKPTNSTSNDLKKIKGIGVKIETQLHDAGIFTYKQIASWSKDDIEAMNEKLRFKGRIEREEWIEQAKKLLG